MPRKIIKEVYQEIPGELPKRIIQEISTKYISVQSFKPLHGTICKDCRCRLGSLTGDNECKVINLSMTISKPFRILNEIYEIVYTCLVDKGSKSLAVRR